MMLSRMLAIALALGMTCASALAQNAGMDNPTRNAYLNAMKGKRVVFIPQTLQADLTIGWNKMLQRQADEMGYTLEVRDANWNTDAGARALATAIANKPDLIVVNNPDVQSYARLIKQAIDANIKVLQINLESAQRSDAYVGADWVGIGVAAGKEVVARCAKGKGRSTKVQIVMGVPTSADNLYQIFGFRKALADSPEIQIVSQQAGSYDPTKARAITASVLQQHPDLCASFGIWDGMDSGTGAAVKEAGLSGKVFVITSGGAAESTCQKIKEGIFSMSVSYDVRVQGAGLNALVASLLQSKGRVEPVTYYSPTRLITKDNMTPSSCWTMGDLL